MSIIRNEAGAIRLAWRLILIILLYVAVAVLLRLIPIGLLTVFHVRSGMTQASALGSARSTVFEEPVYLMPIGILSGLMGLLIVWFLLRVIEKSSFRWTAVGLDWRRNSYLAILLGVALSLLLSFTSILIGTLLGSTGTSLDASIRRVSVPVIFQDIVLWLAMGFGEEIVFRGYVQARLVERYGATYGVTATAVIFVLLHQISYRLSPVIILSGVMLWITIGTLYHLSKSLYLVIIFHGMLNVFQNTLHVEVSDTSSMIVHSLALFLIIVFSLIWQRALSSRLNPV
nr:CPBP family intramembrane metalloprotease [Anaerolineae bacterium]